MAAIERRSGYRRPGRPSFTDAGRNPGRRARRGAAEQPARPARNEPDNRVVAFATIEETFGMDVEEAHERYERLTERQRQVAELMARGLTNRQIADELGISPKTLDIHRADTFEKLEARTSAAVGIIVFLVMLDEAAESPGGRSGR